MFIKEEHIERAHKLHDRALVLAIHLVNCTEHRYDTKQKGSVG